MVKRFLLSVILSWVAPVFQSKALSRTVGFLMACLVACFGARRKLDMHGISNEMTQRQSRMESFSPSKPSGMCWWVSWKLPPSGKTCRHPSFLSTAADALSHWTSQLQERPLGPPSSALGMRVPAKHLSALPWVSASDLCVLYALTLTSLSFCLWWSPLFCGYVYYLKIFKKFIAISNFILPGEWKISFSCVICPLPPSHCPFLPGFVILNNMNYHPCWWFNQLQYLLESVDRAAVACSLEWLSSVPGSSFSFLWRQVGTRHICPGEALEGELTTCGSWVAEVASVVCWSQHLTSWCIL